MDGSMNTDPDRVPACLDYVAPASGVRRGIFGGTFDPIHYGHLAAAEEARAILGLRSVIFVPNARQPLKAPGAVSAAHRIAMVERAIADNSHFEVSDVELRREGPSYTLDTLRALRAEYAPDEELYFLLGVDAFANFAAWRQPAEIVKLAHLVVMSRSGVIEPDWPAIEHAAPGARQRVHLLTVPDLDISATHLRARLAAGLPVRYQIPEQVRTYIAQHDLYR